jgi:hypothetical protein
MGLPTSDEISCRTDRIDRARRVPGVANGENGEPEAQKQGTQRQQGSQTRLQPVTGSQNVVGPHVGCRREQRQVGDRRGEAHLEQGLGSSEVARLANAELHQACDAVLHHLASSSSVIEGRAGLEVARLLEQGFLRMKLHRPPTRAPRALRAQRARGARLGGKHEHATSPFQRSQVTDRLLIRAGTRASLQIDLKIGLGKVALVPFRSPPRSIARSASLELHG